MTERLADEARLAADLEPMPPRSPRPVPRWLRAGSELAWRFLVIAVAVGLVVWAASKIALVVVPLIVALLVATVLTPPVVALVARGVPRTLAALGVFAGALAVIGVFVALVVPPVIGEFDELGQQVNLGVEEIADWVAERPIGLSQAEAVDRVNDVAAEIRENVDAITQRVVSGAMLAFELFAGAVIALFLTFFFLKDGPAMWAWIVRHLPSHRQETAEEVGTDGWQVLGRYVRGLVFVATVDAVFIGLGLWVLGVPLVLPLAMLTFMLAFIPFVGAITAGVTATLVALVSEGFGTAVATTVLVIAVQQLEGNVLYPLIMGRSLRLHPAVILVAVVAGGLTFGVAGAFLAVPVTAAVASTLAVVARRADEEAPGVLVARRAPPP